MEVKIFTKVNDGSYKEYFKGSQKDVYALSAQLRARATSKGFKRHYDGCGNIGTSIKYTNKDSVVYVHICTSEEQERMFRFNYQF